MNLNKKRLNEFKLYAITDINPLTLTLSPQGRGQGEGEILNVIKEALRGGVDIIQLRSKGVSDRFLLELGKKIRQMTLQMKKLFMVNDRVDLMLALNADGVHLGQDDLPIKMARAIIKNKSKFIGCSTHSVEQARQAAREGADYIGYGPIFETPTKPTYPPVGLDSIQKVVRKIKIPVVCIGGIDQSNAKSVIKAGANRIAVVRAIFSSAHPFHAARELKRMIS